MIVDEDVVQTLRTGDGRLLRVFVASCAERWVPLFGLFRGADPTREADVEQVVETLELLWDLDVPARAFGDRQAALHAYPEVAGDDEFSAVADECSLAAVDMLLTAVSAVHRSSTADAIMPAHIDLTEADLIDQNAPGSAWFSLLRQRQRDVLAEISAGILTDEIRDRDRELGRQLIEVITQLLM